MNRQSRIGLSVVTVGLAIGWLSSPGWADDKSNPTGTWTWSFTTQSGQTIESTLKLKLDGDKLTGTYIGRGGQETAIENASFKNDQLTFQVTRERDGNKFTMKFTGKVAGDSLTGSIETNSGGQTRTRELAAKRAGSTATTTAARRPSRSTKTGRR